ncbi:magnesium and cobalt transport protein CorA [Paracidovorax citrulli]
MGPIVNCVAYRNGKRLGEVAVDDIDEALLTPGTFVWLGLHEPDAELLTKVQQEFGLHDLAVEDARNAHQRPKLESYGQSLFVVLNTAQLNGETVELGETHLFVGDNYVVSVRHGPGSTYAPVRDRCEHEPHGLAKGPGYVLYALLDFVVDHYMPIVNQLEDAFEALEHGLFEQSFDREAIQHLYHIKRQVLRLRNAVSPIEEMCGQLIRLHENIVPKELRAYFRDVEDHARRLLGTLDVVREMVTTAIQVNLALVSVRQNEVVKRLAGWGAILAIPTVMFSLYGMNFEFMPELKWHFAYPAVVGVTLVGCVALWRRLRRAGYL